MHRGIFTRLRTATGRCTSALLTVLVIIGPAALTVAADQPADSASVPQAAVSVLNRLSGGPHPGYRANHAKGVLLTGHFTANKAAASITKAAHLKPGRTVPVLVRFSNATGVPELPDADPNASPHGMAIRFTLPDGATTDIVSISANYFPVARPEEFVQLLTAIADSGPDAPKPAPIESFMMQHPRAAVWAQTPRQPPQSFATLAFYGVNAFRFTNAAGQAHFIRYEILPVAGEHSLSPDEIRASPADYLMTEIRERVAKHPAKFRLVAQVADAGDAVNDSSIAWPATRTTVSLGILTIDGIARDQVATQKQLMFNPLSLTAGIEPSDDPILLIRPAAYALSYIQRAT